MISVGEASASFEIEVISSSSNDVAEIVRVWPLSSDLSGTQVFMEMSGFPTILDKSQLRVTFGEQVCDIVNVSPSKTGTGLTVTSPVSSAEQNVSVTIQSLTKDCQGLDQIHSATSPHLFEFVRRLPVVHSYFPTTYNVEVSSTTAANLTIEVSYLGTDFINDVVVIFSHC